MDKQDLVRRGYDRVAQQYLQARLGGVDDLPLFPEFRESVPPGALVLDAGCGAGIPLTRRLTRSYRVVGVDFSRAQLRLASELVPLAHYACQDLTALGIAPHSVDGVCSYYAIIHIPRSKHHDVLRSIHAILRPGGLALLCLGGEDNENDEGSYLGVPMYWSHFDAATYLTMLTTTGFSILRSAAVPDPIDKTGAHLFVLAQKGGA